MIDPALVAVKARQLQAEDRRHHQQDGERRGEGGKQSTLEVFFLQGGGKFRHYEFLQSSRKLAAPRTLEALEPVQIERAHALITAHQIELIVAEEVPLQGDLVVVGAAQDVLRLAEAVRIKEKQVLSLIHI